MSRYNTVPVGAATAAFFSATVKDEDGATFPVSVELFSGSASDGYKTDYTPRAAFWLLVRKEGNTFACWRYTGRRVAKARPDFDCIVRDLAAARID